MMTAPKRTGPEEKHPFFVPLNEQEIRYLEELAGRDQAAQGRGAERPLQRVVLSDPVLRDGEFSCRIQHHSNVAMTPSSEHGAELGCQPQTQELLCHRALELLGFAQQDVFVHVLCHQNVFVFILTTKKTPKTNPKPTTLLHRAVFAVYLC